MKIPAKIYARAFAEAAYGKHSPETGKKMAKNFVTLVRKNGDGASLPKIFEAAEKMLREKEGVRKVMIETARPLSDKLRKNLHALAGKKDLVEERVAPSLIAGVRLTVDDERQFDATLKKRLQQIFT